MTKHSEYKIAEIYIHTHTYVYTHKHMEVEEKSWRNLKKKMQNREK